MKTRRLGKNGPIVSAIGLGCMGMAGTYGEADETESVATLDRALELGITFYDTADVYGPNKNEELLGRWLKGKRDQVVLATKFGITREPGQPQRVNGRPEYVRAAIDRSLKRLQTDRVDLYYLHRVDPDTPIEETVGAMGELVRAGKVGAIGLSEAGAQTLERAHKEYPLTALQSEYSLWTRDPEDEVLGVCRKLGIGFVPFSPLGRGFLTGKLVTEFDDNDFRKGNPRFAQDNLARNMKLAERVKELAAAKGTTPAQLALAWVLAQGDDILPIPGTKRRRYLEENVEAVDVTLTAKELAELDEAFPRGVAAGARYSPEIMKTVGR